MPEKIICPICENEMKEMKPLPDQDPNLSTLSAVVEGERVHAKTIIYTCFSCGNIQSFLKWENA